MARVELNRNNEDEEIMVWNETVPSAPKRLGKIESGKTEKVLNKSVDLPTSWKRIFSCDAV